MLLLNKIFTRLVLPGVLASCMAGLGQASIAGFGDFTLNGGATVSGGTLTLTDGQFAEARSAFDNTLQDITGFSAQFTYQATDGTNPRADGVTFVIQNDPRGVHALSESGSGLGYGAAGNPGAPPITPSVAVEFNLFLQPGINVRTNGATGSYISTAPVDLNSSHPIQATLSYDGVNLVVALLDTVNNNAFSRSFPISIPVTVGASFAYVGFTGATGGFSSIQTISGFSYSPVAPPPTAVKTFNPTAIVVGGTSTLSIKITNLATTGITNVSFTDTLPAGMTIFSPSNLTANCGGVPFAGGSTLSLTGGALAAGANCVVSATVQGTAAGTLTNSTGPIMASASGTTLVGTAATATLTVLAPPTLSKSFGTATLQTGASTTLAFTLSNPAGNPSALTGLTFSDTLPSGLVVSTPNGLTGSCGGGAISATAGTSSISLTGATLAAGASCTFSTNVTGTAAGVQNNTTSTVTDTQGVTGLAATASITVVAPPTLSKSFGTATLQTGASTTLSFTLTNPAANPLSFTGLAFSDPLPGGLNVSTPNGLTGSCGSGTITAVAGTSTISLSGATLAAGASCTFSINVTGTAAGVQNNTTSTVTDTQGATGLAATASITVVLPPSITKAFTDAELQLFGASTALNFTITNPNANPGPLTGIAFTDTLPSGLAVSTPSGLTGSCGGGTITAVPGSSSISLSGATLAAGASCTFSLNVTGTAVGVFTNTTGPVTAFGGTVVGNTATATISVDFLYFYWFFAA